MAVLWGMREVAERSLSRWPPGFNQNRPWRPRCEAPTAGPDGGTSAVSSGGFPKMAALRQRRSCQVACRTISVLGRGQPSSTPVQWDGLVFVRSLRRRSSQLSHASTPVGSPRCGPGWGGSNVCEWGEPLPGKL